MKKARIPVIGRMKKNGQVEFCDGQPKVTDFTTVLVPFPTEEFALRVKLDSRWVTVGIHPTREGAETAELAINQMMVEYRTKRNAYEKELADAKG